MPQTWLTWAALGILAGSSLNDAFVRLVEQALAAPASRPAAIVVQLRKVVRRSGAPALALRLNETLVAVGPAGDVVDSVDGTLNKLHVGEPLNERLLDAAAAITLVHNHPGGSGLSGNDLGHLSKPGVRAMVAVGHDGSLYAAAAGPNYPPKGFEEWLFPVARREVIRGLRTEAPSAHVDVRVFDPYVDHLVAAAMDRVHVIEYSADLGSSRLEIARRFERVFAHVVTDVAAKVVSVLHARDR